MAELTDERILEMAHRIASRYRHHKDAKWHGYDFYPHTIIDFARAIAAEVADQAPVAWIQPGHLDTLRNFGALADLALLAKPAMHYTVPLYTHPQAPAGWKLVPIEPTPEMVAAYLKANTEYWDRVDKLPDPRPLKWRNGTPKEATAESYAAMLSAAPSPKGTL